MAVSKSRKKKKEEEEAAAASEAEAAARDLGTTPDVAAAEDDAATEDADAAEVVPVEAPSMPALLPKLRVMKQWRGSIRGHITTLAEGKVLDPRGYGGAKGIEALKKAGLELEEVV